jgi:hypothetical protein
MLYEWGERIVNRHRLDFESPFYHLSDSNMSKVVNPDPISLVPSQHNLAPKRSESSDVDKEDYEVPIHVEEIPEGVEKEPVVTRAELWSYCKHLT